jgi:hypothetical protein
MSDTTYVPKLPNCDIHMIERNGTIVPAAVDGKTKRGPWAAMCESCFTTHGVGLGTGRGQRYVVGTKPKPDKAIEDMSYDELEELVGDGDIADFF